MRNFGAFILTHGRPNNVRTYETLRRCGYTGDVYFVVDDEDEALSEYIRLFGDGVKVFDKRAEADCVDEGNNFDDRRTITHARNACFHIALEVGLSHFVQLDDDYYFFGTRDDAGARTIRRLDAVFSACCDFLDDTSALCIAFSQGGDHIGGFCGRRLSRKAMNSFVCRSDRSFQFVGSLNEDVNTYVSRGARGDLFFTFSGIQLDQKDTQSMSGGITETYEKYGTYVKSFTTVMYAPSTVRVGMMSTRYKRLHHLINWDTAVPKIIPSVYAKTSGGKR